MIPLSTLLVPTLNPDILLPTLDIERNNLKQKITQVKSCSTVVKLLVCSTE